MSEKRIETVKRADALTVGDHVMHQQTPFDNRRPLRVLFAHPFRDGDGIRRVSLMLDTPQGPVHERPMNCDTFELADEQDLAEAHDTARRQQLLDDLIALRHVLDAAGVRMSTYQANPFYVHVVEGEVDRLADVLAAEVRPFGEGTAMAVEWTAPGGTDLGDRLHVKLWGRRAPEPQPEVETEQEWLFTFGSGQQHDGRFVRITGTHASARARMLEVFGTAWCDQYDWRRFDELGLPAVLTELPDSEWTDGEVVAGIVAALDGPAADVPAQRSGE